MNDENITKGNNAQGSSEEPTGMRKDSTASYDLGKSSKAPKLFDDTAASDLDKETNKTEGKKKAEAKKKPTAKKKVKREHKIIRRIGITFCAFCLIGIVSVSSVGLFVLKSMTDFVNGPVAIDLDEYKSKQSQTTILYTVDNSGNETELIRLHGEENRIWVDLDEMPKNLQNAFIALEDIRFKAHRGVDWKRTVAVAVIPSNDGQGGSTITQQLIKNLTGERDVTYIRKFNEIKNALNLEKHYSKETILETYLNTLYLDAGCYGVQTASEYYFGKNVSELNLAECACIAAITQKPRGRNPIINPENNRERMEYCLDVMVQHGMISQKDCDSAKAYDLVFTTDDDYVPKVEDKKEPSDNMININENNVGKTEDEQVQSYYVDYVIDKVIEDLMETRSYSYSEAWRLVYYGGLKIHVAVDLDVQQKLEDLYYNRKGFPTVKNSKGEEVQSCMVIMDYTGRVCGIVGQAGPKEGARSLNIATQSRRQPGSSIKPLSVYSLAINTGEYSWSYPMIQNYGIMLDGDRWPYNFGRDPGSPYHYETIQQALAPSHNTVPAQLVQKLGIDTCYDWLKDAFKFTCLEEADRGYSALAVGGMTHGVYAIEMCAGYTTFGSGGIYYEPYCYYTVTNSSGSIVYLTHNDQGEQVMERGTAEVMNKLLQTVTTSYNGTGRNYKISGFDTFVKTGTTSDEKDRWFIGGSPYYVCATWIGFSQHAEELNFASNYLGDIYVSAMNSIHKNLPSKSFEFSEDIVQRSYCTNTGRLASRGCPQSTGWYRADALPPSCVNCVRISAPVEGTTSSSQETSTAPNQNIEVPTVTVPSNNTPVPPVTASPVTPVTPPASPENGE